MSEIPVYILSARLNYTDILMPQAMKIVVIFLKGNKTLYFKIFNKDLNWKLFNYKSKNLVFKGKIIINVITIREISEINFTSLSILHKL